MYVCDVLATGVSRRLAEGGAGVRCVPVLVALVACGASDGGVPSARPPPVPCERTLEATPVVQSGPLCVAAAALQAMSARAGSPENAGNATTPLRDLARSVVVRPDGVDLYDLQRELRVRGWESLVFTGPPEAGALGAEVELIEFLRRALCLSHLSLSRVRLSSIASTDPLITADDSPFPLSRCLWIRWSAVRCSC